MARFGRDIQIDKKGTIDLVTEVDVAVERMFRALIAERFPDHAGARRGNRRRARRAAPGRAGSSIRSTARRTTRTACRSSARRSRSRSTASRRSRAVYDPNAQGTVHGRARRRRVPERPAAARLVGATRWSTRCSSPAFRTTCTRASTRSSACSRAFVGRARAVRRLGSAAIDLCYVAAGRMDGFWESDLKPWDIAGGALIVAEAGGRVTTHGRRAVHVARRPGAGHQRPPARRDARTIQGKGKRQGRSRSHVLLCLRPVAVSFQRSGRPDTDERQPP